MLPPQSSHLNISVLVTPTLWRCPLTGHITPQKVQARVQGAVPASQPSPASPQAAPTPTYTTPRQARAPTRERRAAPRVWGRVERANSPPNTQLPTHRHVATTIIPPKHLRACHANSVALSPHRAHYAAKGSGARPGSCPRVAAIPGLPTGSPHADIHDTTTSKGAHSRTQGGATGLGARREG